MQPGCFRLLFGAAMTSFPSGETAMPSGVVQVGGIWTTPAETVPAAKTASEARRLREVRFIMCLSCV